MDNTLTAKINTLNSMLPQKMPFVVSQVSLAIKKIKDLMNFDTSLDNAIYVTGLINKYSQGDLLYNYIPIILTLLKDIPETESLDEFDTINHDIPFGVTLIKQFLDTYSKKAKTAASTIIDILSDGNNNNVCMVILAGLLADLKEGKNVLAIAYIITNLNMSHVQFVNESYQIYCDILSEIAKAEF